MNKTYLILFVFLNLVPSLPLSLPLSLPSSFPIEIKYNIMYLTSTSLFEHMQLRLVNKHFQSRINGELESFKKLNLDQIISNRIILLLQKKDSQIDFEYHFSENSNGDFHNQNYSIFPLSSDNTKKMKTIILCIQYIAHKSSLSINQVAAIYRCFQYMRFHEEFCFRAIIPLTRCAWRSHYQYFITNTFDKYIGCFDENYTVNWEFSPDPEWLIEKIKNSKSKLNNKVDSNCIGKLIKNNTNFFSQEGFDGKILTEKLNLFELIVFLGELHPFTQPSENQTFTQYISGLMIKPLQITIDPETNEVQVPIEPTIIENNTKPETNEVQVPIESTIIEINTKTETNKVKVPIEPTIIEINTKTETNKVKIPIEPKKTPLIDNKNIVKQFYCYLKSRLTIGLHFIKKIVNTIKTFLQRYKP